MRSITQHLLSDRGFTTRGQFFCGKKRRRFYPPPCALLQIDFHIQQDGMTLKFSLEHAVIHQGKAADFFKAERKSRACFHAEPFVFFRFDDIACAVGQYGGSVLIAAGKVVRNGGFQFGNERSGGVCPQSI